MYTCQLFSQSLFPKRQLPKGIFPSGKFPSVHFPNWKISNYVQVAALGNKGSLSRSQCSTYPTHLVNALHSAQYTVYCIQCSTCPTQYTVYCFECWGQSFIFILWFQDFKKVTQASEIFFLQIYQFFILTLLSLQREQIEEPKTKNYAYL